MPRPPTVRGLIAELYGISSTQSTVWSCFIFTLRSFSMSSDFPDHVIETSVLPGIELVNRYMPLPKETRLGPTKSSRC